MFVFKCKNQRKIGFLPLRVHSEEKLAENWLMYQDHPEYEIFGKRWIVLKYIPERNHKAKISNGGFIDLKKPLPPVAKP